MNVFIKGVKINDPSSPWNDKIVNVFVKDGEFHAIGDIRDAEPGVPVLEGTGAVLSPGWFDMRVYFREPGDEQKETILSGLSAAAQGGFTGVLMMPSTHPPLQSNADITFVKQQGRGHLTDLFPAGVLTEEREGKHLAGLYDMKMAGAVAFTDDKRVVTDSGVMCRALQYAANIETVIIAYADDPGLTANLQTNQSPVTTLLGYKGAPAIAEEIAIQRDLSLVKYVNQAIHFSGISTKEALEAIRQAKRIGLPVSAEVYIYHLLLDDSALHHFDSNYKVKPPLRSPEDVIALREAVLDGTIDVICSDHSPEDTESKNVEFDYAAFGMIGLESFYGLLRESFDGKLSAKRLYELLVENPRRILKLTTPVIQEGQRANFTCYHPDRSWQLTTQQIKSKSANSPFIGRAFTGKVLACGNNGRICICD